MTSNILHNTFHTAFLKVALAQNIEDRFLYNYFSIYIKYVKQYDNVYIYIYVFFLILM